MKLMLLTLLVVVVALLLAGTMLLTIWLLPLLVFAFWIPWLVAGGFSRHRDEGQAHGHAYESED